MLKNLRQVRAAVSLLSPEEVRRRAARPVTLGLMASGRETYRQMEELFATATSASGAYDIVVYEEGLPHPDGTFAFYSGAPETTLKEILRANDDLALPLARQYPAFRKLVVDDIVQSVARENALFSIATALPNVAPSLIELPWAFGEFASDTAFLTMNQLRMAFLVAAACGKEIGFSRQKTEILAIAAGAFGWRALARELAGHIPFGGGLIPKGAIAYAGTYVIGKGLEHYHQAGAPLSRGQREEMFQHALRQGRQVARSLSPGN